MFNHQTSTHSYFAKSALEIDLRVRDQERKLALMNAEEASQPLEKRNFAPNHFLSLVTSFLGLVR